jgi:hypothetical protein
MKKFFFDVKNDKKCLEKNMFDNIFLTLFKIVTILL